MRGNQGSPTTMELDFGDTRSSTASEGAAKAGVRLGGHTRNRRSPRLALSSRFMQGAHKFQVLEHRRRQAQIKARRVLRSFE
jgi:hypothetical protein